MKIANGSYLDRRAEIHGVLRRGYKWPWFGRRRNYGGGLPWVESDAKFRKRVINMRTLVCNGRPAGVSRLRWYWNLLLNRLIGAK